MTRGTHVPAELTRRALLLGAGGTAAATLLASCSKSTGGSSSASNSKTRYLVPFFATGQNEPPILRTGLEQRMPWGVADNEGIPLATLPDSVDVTLKDASGQPVGSRLTTQRRGDGTPFPYFAVRVSLATAGTYTVSLPFEGHTLESQVVIVTPDKVPLVQPGERAIPVMTPTPADHRGVEPICTREPPCPFHDVTLSAALTSGKPTAFLISTPAFCQSNVCGPVLDLLVDEAPRRQLNAIHAEVYADAAQTGDPLKAKLSEATSTYKLSFEPSLIVTDAQGIVVDRLDFVFDRSELRSVLDKVT